MRRGLRWLGRNGGYLLTFATCATAGAAVLAGRLMPWWMQLTWIGATVFWTGWAADGQRTIRRQAQTLQDRERPISCAQSGCPVRLNGHGAGRFEQLAHDLWMWSPEP